MTSVFVCFFLMVGEHLKFPVLKTSTKRVPAKNIRQPRRCLKKKKIEKKNLSQEERNNSVAVMTKMMGK